MSPTTKLTLVLIAGITSAGIAVFALVYAWLALGPLTFTLIVLGLIAWAAIVVKATW